MPRRPYPPPHHTDNGNTVTFHPRGICFLHPGYESACQTFLILPAADVGATLHHETARLACAVVAGNRVDGFLSQDRDGQRPVVNDTEFLLSEAEYYFQVPGIDGKATGLDLEYPITPSFQHWCPPRLPSYWQRCVLPQNPPYPTHRATSMQVLNRDISCRMTQCKEATEIAHIIPVSVNDWFRSHAMHRIADFDDPSNAILLRSDIHTIWDSRICTILPKDSTGTSALVMYVLKRDCPEEVIGLYHDVELQPLYGVNLDFLFVRFAWTIFGQSSIEAFVEQGVKRYLKLRSEDGKIEDKWCSDTECRTLMAHARSASPVKRLRKDLSTIEGEVTSFGSYYSGSGADTVCAEDAEAELYAYEDRGRKRRRTYSSSSSSSSIQLL